MPAAVYNGGHNGTTKVGLRIANGGAGQSGLIGAWGDAFINYMVGKGHEPFTVEWYLGDTTQSIEYLEKGQVDVAVTYNEAAERQVYDSELVSAWLYGFHDHFYFVGPPSNPAQLSTNDSILAMARRIVQVGNQQAAVPPTNGTVTRFLSRYDKSATNIKESEIFIKIGQVPWAYAYSKWYHQYPRFPIQALEAASLLSEYTLTDRGTWLSSSPDVRSRLTIFKAGTDNETDILLNPARVLIAKEDNLVDKEIGQAFGKWVVLYDEQNKTGGQNVIETFTGTGQTGETKEPLYTRAPVNWSPANSTAGQ
ncbi:hypothetical protein AGABI2DRAFT_211210 [Agaricus bisporus var. bisporus H97]|uniref:hypothetical protein n=1 Tax=Agaricus bisporus var. bisporus (strain H97 / ATCC MYA-4626 / FGSC 10389) TaxID=936046 RepID=UPI00029F7E10|nr:hypothetical protein AGABI2DRAFT_211210 [Agaricus bisporus var. bisporus H97]EKV43308.1 hypothetical protein AGABI2DRAFT_211210 [Agaricus bisporus var. bisporus H97]